MNDDLTLPCKAEEGRFADGNGEDELVNCEMEAAQALAGLAHPVSKNDEFLVPGPSGRSEEQVIEIQSEQESELKTSPQHTLNYPPVASRRSRRNLTEEEKEERRLCRVLANRESARQTIRRRQAMYEELTRKSADLASESENLKKKKELATKEYDYLKNENASLRLQIAKIEKAEAEETDGASRSKPVKISTTSTGPAPAPAPNPTPTPASLFNQSPITPFFWPPIVQPFNSFLLQCSTQDISDIMSVLPSLTAGELNSINSQQSSNPGNPLYVLPFPCFIPFHPQNNPFHPWSSTHDKHAETSGVHQCSTTYPNMENNQAVTAQEGETDAPDSVKAPQRDFRHKATLGFPPDGDASEESRQPSGVHSRKTALMTAASSSHIQPGTSRQSDSSRQHNTPDINTVSCTTRHVGDTSEKGKTSQKSITCSSEKTVDAMAATEARRRRKELMSFKGHHSDQFGPHQ